MEALADQSDNQLPNYPITPLPNHVLPMTSALFFDPKPRQLQRAASASPARPRFGMTSRSQSGSASRWLMVGGRKPRDSASAAVTTPAAPLAPCGCPIIDFTDDPASRSACAPNTWRTHRVSTASFSCVEVP